MIATFLNQLLTESVEALPRIFIVGAPILALVIAVAAFVDARMSGTDDHARPN